MQDFIDKTKLWFPPAKHAGSEVILKVLKTVTDSNSLYTNLRKCEDS